MLRGNCPWSKPYRRGQDMGPDERVVSAITSHGLSVAAWVGVAPSHFEEKCGVVHEGKHGFAPRGAPSDSTRVVCSTPYCSTSCTAPARRGSERMPASCLCR